MTLTRSRPIASLFALLAAVSLTWGCGDTPSVIVPLDLGAAPAYDVTFADLVAELVDPTALPAPETPFGLIATSSYDPASVSPGNPEWFANRDRGNYLGTDAFGHSIMAEHRGPGALVRLWSANPTGTIRIYIDDERTPLIVADMDSLMDAGSEFDEPFSYTATFNEPGLRGANLYVPMPFSQYVRVTHELEPDPPSGQLYWQASVRTYDEGLLVEPFDASMLGAPSNAARAALEGLRPTVGAGEDMLDWSASAAETSFDAPGEGAVLEDLCLTVGDVPAETTVVEMTFDGVTTVRAPLRDLTGGLATTSTTFYSSYESDVSRWCVRFPMPFASSARLRVIAADAAPGGRQLRVQYTLTPAAAPATYFHAQFTRSGDQVLNRSDFTAVDIASGSGRFVGLSFAANNGSRCWWGEGDEKIYVDGESFPSVFGTGTEDYFGFAWSTDEIFVRPFHGQPDADTGHGLDTGGHADRGGTWWNFRWHQTDPIPFTSSLRFDMEVWHWCGSPEEPSTAPLTLAFTGFWYGDTAQPAPTVATLSPRPGVLPVSL